MEELKDKNFCLAPWNLIRIENEGNCFSCSSAYVKDNFYFGNIFTDDIEEIWNGEKAKQFRADKLSGAYKFCKIDKCQFHAKKFEYYDMDQDYDTLTAKNPKYVILSYDSTCSEKCVFCRDKIITTDKNLLDKYESILYSKIIPLLKTASILEITGWGEIFLSSHSQKMLKEIIKNIPNIKLVISTNGVYLTEERLNELGITNNIDEIRISIHSTSAKVYKKIFRRNNFNKVIKNLEFISKLKKENKIKKVSLQFVITKDNFKEIKPFIKMAKKYGFGCAFHYVVGIATKFRKNPYNHEIYNPGHYLYNAFVKCVQDNEVKEYLPKYMQELKPVSRMQIIKNYIRYLLYLLKILK